MKKSVVKLVLSVLLTGILAGTAQGQFQYQAQDNYWTETAWSHGLTLSRFNLDYGMVADSSGRVYVATGSQIAVFDTNTGILTQSWSVADVQDVALCPGTNLLVTCSFDTSPNPIKIYDTSGNFIRQWGTSGSATGQMVNPSSVAVGPDNLVYVADFGNNRIEVFDLLGNFIRMWGQFGNTSGQFNTPRYVAVGPSNSVYVADYGNHSIQFFDTQGTFIRQYSDPAWNPKGIFVSPDGGFIVGFDSSTSATGRRWLTPDGQLLTTVSDVVMYGSTWSVNGQRLYYLTGSQIIATRRGYHTMGTNPPNAIPLPTILGAAQRSGALLFDIDYSVIDPDDTNVTTGVLALNNGRQDLGGIIPMATFVEGTASSIGTNISTGQRHRITWNAGVDWVTNSGIVSFAVLAKDNRGLLDFHFITIPSNSTYATPLTISQSPYTQTDFLGVWSWLIATGNTNILLQTGGNVLGTGGVYSNVLLAQTVGTTTTTTTQGRGFLWSLMNVREATTNELFRAAMGTTGKVTQWQPRNMVGNAASVNGGTSLPGKVNEYSFDTKLFSTALPFVPVTNVWWAVMLP